MFAIGSPQQPPLPLNSPPLPELVPSYRFRYTPCTHTHTIPHPLLLPQLPSQSPGLGFQNQCSYQSLSDPTQPLTRILTQTHPFLSFIFTTLSISLSPHLSISFLLSSFSLPASVLCLLSYTCPNLFHLIGPPQ